MFCGHCGKEVTVGAKFCPNCGAAIENQPVPTEGQPKTPTVEQPGNPIKKPIAGNGQSGKGKKGMPKPLIIVAAVLVLFIGFGAILNLFDGGNEPTSGSGDSDGLDWVEKIPVVNTRMIGNIFEADSDMQQETADNLKNLPTMTYLDYQEKVGDLFNMMGMTTNDKIIYYQADRMFGFYDNNVVYLATMVDGTVASSPACPQSEPLIARLQTSKGDMCLLFYKEENGYLILGTLPPTDPSIGSYLTWKLLLVIMVPSQEYCSFLNGEQELEIVSIPGESRNTNSVSQTSVPDWVDSIPVVPGSQWFIGNVNDARIQMMLNGASQISFAELKESFGKDFNYLGIIDSEDIEYYDALTTVGICDNKTVYILSDATTGDGQGKTINSFSLRPNGEPLILRDENESGIYYLCYKQENCYQILVATTNDPTTPYLGWNLAYSILTASQEYCGLLNGSSKLEIVSVPGKYSTPNQDQPKEDAIYEDFWTGNWDEIDGRTHMTIAPTTTGYDILISGANGAADMVELRLTGQGNGDGGIACVGEEWNIHYPDGRGDPIETLVSRDCVGTISGDADYVGIIMYNDFAGKYNLTFVYEGESLPDSYIQRNNDVPYVDIEATVIGQQFTPLDSYRVLDYDYPFISFYPVNDIDGVTYYSADEGQRKQIYGVRNGQIVAYMDTVEDSPEVRARLTADFDGIEPKSITKGERKYLVWEVGNGYTVFEVTHSGRGYLYDMIESLSYFADKEMCSLLTDN